MSKSKKAATLEIGKTYRVDIEDCCVNIKFKSQLIASTDGGEVLEFENGVTIYDICVNGFTEVE